MPCKCVNQKNKDAERAAIQNVSLALQRDALLHTVNNLLTIVTLGTSPLPPKFCTESVARARGLVAEMSNELPYA